MQHATPEIFENTDWVFPEEFLRELVAAQMRYAQKLAREVKDTWGIANSAIIRSAEWFPQIEKHGDILQLERLAKQDLNGRQVSCHR